MSESRLRLLLYPEAERDIGEQSVYIADESIDSALRFYDQTRAAFDFLCQHPEAGAVPKWHSASLSGVRVWPVQGFEKWLVIYRATESDLSVLRVVHGARDLEFLFGR